MQRLFFLDWLRFVVLLILVPYHVGMVYVTWAFHVKSPAASSAPEMFMLLSSPWRMSVLFLVSGAATWLYLEKVPKAAALRNRSKRLLAPLLCGVVLLVPPQSYVQVMQTYGYSGSYLQFLGLYFTGSRQFCQAGTCLILPTWNHLWFLPYLWVYTLLLGCLSGVFREKLRTAMKRPLVGLEFFAFLLAPLVFLLIGRATLAGRFPQSHDLIQDWFNHWQYLLMFMLGAYCAARPSVWPQIARFAWVSLGVVVLAWGALLLTRSMWWLSVQQWSGVLAALGLAYRYANRDHPWRRWLCGAVFQVYVVHQTWIVLLVWGLRSFAIPAYVEAPLIILLTLVLSVLSYVCVARLPWAKTWFGVGKQDRMGVV